MKPINPTKETGHSCWGGGDKTEPVAEAQSCCGGKGSKPQPIAETHDCCGSKRESGHESPHDHHAHHHHHGDVKPSAAAKYFCPMCPGVESDKPGDCPMCGMALERNPSWKAPTIYTCPMQSAREGLQALAGDGRGLVAAVWLDLRGGGMEPWVRTSRDGGATWGDDVSIYRSPDGHICECCVPSVAISPTGEIAAMWRNCLSGSRDLYIATSRDGRTFFPAQKLGTGTWNLNGCPMDGGSLAFAPDGNWLAVWRRERAIFASSATTPEMQLTGNAAQPITACAGKTPLTLWEANGALMLQRGSEAPVRFAENAAAASVVSGPETAVVVWESEFGGSKSLRFEEIR